MSKKRRRQHRQRKKPTYTRPPTRTPRLTTPEGDPLIFASCQYRHTSLEEIHRILKQTNDLGLDDDLKPAPDGSIQFPWLEMDPDAPPLPEPIERRVLAMLTLSPATLVVETISRQRLRACRRRLEQLLGDRIRHTGTRTRTPDQALREPAPPPEPEPLVLPPEAIAEIEERMIRQWLDESIPALGGLTPHEAAKTPKGRELLLDLFDYMARDQERRKMPPGMFSPDYDKAKKMLGME